MRVAQRKQKSIAGYTCLAVTMVATLMILITGCGSGSGGNGGGGNGGGGTKNVSGVWTGTHTPSVGNPGTIEADYVQTGTSVTGTVRIIVDGVSSIGTLTGTVSGSQLNATVDFGANGVSTSTLTVSGNTISGQYSRTLNGVTSTGSNTMTLQSGLTSANVAGSYTGTGTSSGGTTNPLTFSIQQNVDALTITGTSGSGASAAQFTGAGAVIGNHVTFIVTTGTTTTLYIDGTFSGQTLSGTTLSPGPNPGNNGVASTSTFSAARSQSR